MAEIKVWVTGAKGQLGSAIVKLLEKDPETPVVATDRDVDISDQEAVKQFADVHKPQVIINCAALTDLAICERNVDLAFKINALGARNIGVAARRINAKLIHISTDDVFDGTIEHPLTEFDKVNPFTVYGKSKCAGEDFVRDLVPKHMIIRSSWIYGDTKDNYVSYILDGLLNGDTIYVPVDHVSTPTSANELAKVIVRLVHSTEYGTYHASCAGSCSRYQFVKEIVHLTGKNVNVEPLVAGENPSTVNRPRFTILDNFMLRMSGIYEMPDWKTALEEYIKERMAKEA